MKIYVRASESRIPTLQEYLSEVDTKDIDTIQQLMNIKTFNGKLFSAPSSRNELGRTQNYEPEDKVIHIVESQDDYRVYSIPYTQEKYPRVTGIYTFELTCYDDGSFKFGDGKIRRFGEVSDNTLSNDVRRARA